MQAYYNKYKAKNNLLIIILRYKKIFKFIYITERMQE